MSRKRRQRSTAIRKRVEKKQREDAKTRKRLAKLKKGGLDGLMLTSISRHAAEAAVAALTDLETRLKEAPIRGWTEHDLADEYGLSWLNGFLQEVLAANPNANLAIEYPEAAKGPMSDKMGTLEVAAPGLKVDWDAGLHEVAQAFASAELFIEEEDDEEGEGT